MNVKYLDLSSINNLHGDEIRAAVNEVVSSGWYLQGERVSNFEREYAEYTNHKYCISCANGLDALTIMIRGYKELGLLSEGDEVIVPANTYIATILAISENKLKPVLVEPRLETFQIDDSLIEEALSPRTRAIMLVHLYGYNAYTDRVGEICKNHNLLLLEDCAQAHGLRQTRRLADSQTPLHSAFRIPHSAFPGAQAHSFYPGKNLGALADAGAITTDDEDLATICRTLCNYGSSKKYVFDFKGRNSRLDELNAAVLSVKLKYLDQDNARRQELAEYYIRRLSIIPNSEFRIPNLHGVHHIFPILLKNRDQIQAQLSKLGVQTLIHYPIPPHKQQAYREWNHLSLPITEYIHDHELSLPLHQALTDQEAEFVADCLLKLV